MILRRPQQQQHPPPPPPPTRQDEGEEQAVVLLVEQTAAAAAAPAFSRGDDDDDDDRNRAAAGKKQKVPRSWLFRNTSRLRFCGCAGRLLHLGRRLLLLFFSRRRRPRGCSRRQWRPCGSGRCRGVAVLVVLLVLLLWAADHWIGERLVQRNVHIRYPAPLQLPMVSLQQQQQQQQYHDDDSLLASTGKSCHYQRGWHCRDCGGGDDGNKKTNSDCRPLQPRGRCRPVRPFEWDSPRHPRSVSSSSAADYYSYDPATAESAAATTTSMMVPVRTLSAMGHYFYHNQPQCTIQSCFDLDRCSSSSSNSSSPFVLTVFANATGSHSKLVDYAASAGVVRRVDEHRDACLSVTFPDSYPTAADLYGAAHWKDPGGGRNNLVYDWSRFPFHHPVRRKRVSSDAPFSIFHVGRAAVASESLTPAVFRPGYDAVLPLKRQWGRPAAAVDLHRPRRWLLAFRGTVKDRRYAYYHHRWLAAEYWEAAPDVHVDVRCVRSRLFGRVQRVDKPYDDAAPAAYADALWNSTFGFCPGGSGVGSYRLGEVLSTGGIPVVVAPDLILPLEPEVNWTGCAVRVSEARIVDLPAILRRVSGEEIRRRQVRCWGLLQSVLGDGEESGARGLWKSQYHVTFAKAMEIWAARIANALDMRDRMQRINQ